MAEFTFGLDPNLLNDPQLDANYNIGGVLQQPNTNDSSLLSSNNSLLSLDNLGKLGFLGTGLAGLLNAYQQNKLQKKAFKFQKGVANRNIANQAVTINNQLANQAKMQAQMFGNRVGTAEYNNYLNKNQKRVDGSAI